MKRNEIASKFKWNLNHMFETDSDWDKEYRLIDKEIGKYADFEGKLSESGQGLFECLEFSSHTHRRFEKLYVYAHMKSHEDTADSTYQAMSMKADSLEVKLSSASSFIVPEIMTIDYDKLEEFYNQKEELYFYDKYLKDLLRYRKHTLSKEQEMLMAKASELAGFPSSIFSMLDNADISFCDIIGEDGKPAKLTKGSYIQFLESSDRRVRKEAFESMYASYIKQKNTLAQIMSSKVKADLFESDVRSYESPLKMYLFPDNVDETVYESLIKAMEDNMHLLHRYVELRKKLLGVDELHMYDLYTPVVKDVDMKISYEQAYDMVESSLGVLGEDYLKVIKQAKDSGWIDVYENEGKRGGAYSWGCYDSHPYVLLNHNDNLNSAFTLAHELGHAMHSYLSDKSNPYVYAQYKIFVAEVASTVNESLLMEDLLGKTSDKAQKMYLLNYFLEQFRTTVFRQTMFAEFEKKTHELSQSGEILTVDLLNKTYRDLNIKYYGDGIVVDNQIDMEWSRIPHFYTPFYVYKYATGFCAAMAINKSIRDDQKESVPRYLEFLKSGGSDYPIELLKIAGVDMSTPKPVEDAMKLFESLLDQMEELVG